MRRYQAEGIANIVNSFRPEAVLLGGGISREGETLIKPLKRKLKRLLFGDLRYAPVLILASGVNKAEAVYKMVKGEVSEQVPASVLQLHPDCILIADRVTARKL